MPLKRKGGRILKGKRKGGKSKPRPTILGVR